MTNQFTQLPMVPAGDLVVYARDLVPLTALVLGQSTRDPIERVLAEHHQSAELVERGLRPSARLLFHGPPGCGKTASAGALALALGIPLYVVRLDAVIGQYMGETSSHLRKVFEFAGNCKAVVFFDEAESLMGARRNGDGDTGADREMARVTNSVLMMFEEARQFHSILVCATNRQDMIDPAMWRRFDEVIEFPAPSGLEAFGLLKRIVSRHLPTAVIPELREWPRRLAGMSYADVERLATDAVKATVIRKMSIGAALTWSHKNQVARRGRKSKR